MKRWWVVGGGMCLGALVVLESASAEGTLRFRCDGVSAGECQQRAQTYVATRGCVNVSVACTSYSSQTVWCTVESTNCRVVPDDGSCPSPGVKSGRPLMNEMEFCLFPPDAGAPRIPFPLDAAAPPQFKLLLCCQGTTDTCECYERVDSKRCPAGSRFEIGSGLDSCFHNDGGANVTPIMCPSRPNISGAHGDQITPDKVIYPAMRTTSSTPDLDYCKYVYPIAHCPVSAPKACTR